MAQRITFLSQDKTKLAGTLQTAPGRSIVVLAHGITVDKEEDGYFTQVARRLAESNIASFRFDFRAHGESEGQQENMALRGELGDLVAAIKLVEKKGFKNIGILAASFGGSIVALYLKSKKHRENLVCICLWSPILNYETTFLKPSLPWMKNQVKRIEKKLSRKGYGNLYGETTFRLGKKLWQEMKNNKPYQNLQGLNIPTLFIHGDKDNYVPYQDSIKYSKLPAGDSQLITIKGADHGFEKPKEFREVLQATISFFKKHLITKYDDN